MDALLLQGLPREGYEPSPGALPFGFSPVIQASLLLDQAFVFVSLFNQNVFFPRALQAELPWSQELASDLAWGPFFLSPPSERCPLVL